MLQQVRRSALANSTWAFVVATQYGVPVVHRALGGHAVSCVTFLRPIGPQGRRWQAAITLLNEVRGAMLAGSGEPDLAREYVLLPQLPLERSGDDGAAYEQKEK